LRKPAYFSPAFLICSFNVKNTGSSGGIKDFSEITTTGMKKMFVQKENGKYSAAVCYYGNIKEVSDK